MTPQLWPRYMDFIEWRRLHLNLDNIEAERLYMAELKLYQNYEDELKNLTKNRQAKLVNQINVLANDISNILNVNNLIDVYGYNSNIEPIPPSGLIIEGDEVVYIVTEDEETTYINTETQ